MIISLKDIYKMIGILVVSFCAVTVCAMFFNYYLDLATVESLCTTELAKLFFEAQRSNAKVVCAVSGGCLFFTAIVLLCFYIGHYIDTHQTQLGILKALGYSRLSVSKHFFVFGLPVLTGTALGYGCAHLLMPMLYEFQNEDGYLPDVPVSFHLGLFLFIVVIPTMFFSVLAVGYSFLKLNTPALRLIREQSVQKVVTAKKDTDLPFLRELEKSNVRQKKSLLFFVTFAVFCFAAMTQMSVSMNDLASSMIAVMTMMIGLVLAAVTLWIATTSVVNANRKTITMMKVFGYSAGECSRAVLSGYRPFAYFGFALGTVYQYALLKIMVTVVFKDFEGVPDYEFDIPVMFVCLASFVILYEAIMFLYTKQMEKLSVKEIMLE